jgi:hypothetical protein
MQWGFSQISLDDPAEAGNRPRRDLLDHLRRRFHRIGHVT